MKKSDIEKFTPEQKLLYDNLKTIRSNFLLVVGRMTSYKGWTPEFHMEQLKEMMEELPKVSFEHLNKEIADEFGFGRWSDESTLVLFPLWVYPFLTEGDKLHDIFDELIVVGKDYTNNESPDYLDNDVRGGFLPFGKKIEYIKLVEKIA